MSTAETRIEFCYNDYPQSLASKNLAKKVVREGTTSRNTIFHNLFMSSKLGHENEKYGDKLSMFTYQLYLKMEPFF